MDIIWFILYLFIAEINGQKSQLVPLKNTNTAECKGIETFEKVTGVELPLEHRVTLYTGSSTSGAITADCYNRCRSSVSCSAFWIDYNATACYRVSSPDYVLSGQKPDFTKPSSYFERLCFEGNICNKAWVTERISGYELAGYDDVIIRSVTSRKRCAELCLTDKRLPCRSADYWESRNECRLSREDRRTQPGSFVRSSAEVEYIESSCSEPLITKGKHCDWEIMQGFTFPIEDFSSKSDSLTDCQKQCENYTAFTCRSVTYDMFNGICYLSGADVSSTSFSLLESHDTRVYSQRMPCIDMNLECRGDSMVARLKTHSPFYGKMYSTLHHPEGKSSTGSSTNECEIFGHGKLLTTIDYPLNKCGIFKDTDGSYVGNLIVQQHPLIQKRGDAAFKLICSFPESNRTLMGKLGFDRISESRLVEASASTIPTSILGITTSVINATAKSPQVKLKILDKKGQDVTGVNLGDELYLTIDIESSSVYGVFARDLIATSGTNEEELILIDSRGCPEDPAIFPHLDKKSDGSKSLKGRFEAFKFTNDAVVRFQVFLQFCREECPPVNCDGEKSYGRRRKRANSSPFNYENDSGDFLELQKEIIVSGTPKEIDSSDGKMNQFHKNSAQIPRGMKNFENLYIKDDQLELKNYNYNLNNPFKRNENGDITLCGPKNLLIASIIGFCILQILIVFACAACICRRNRKKKSIDLKEPQYYTATRPNNLGHIPAPTAGPPRSSAGSSPDLFYTRPSQANLVNTLRSIANRS